MADGSIEPAATSASIQKAPSRLKRPPSQHPKFIDMVTEAISGVTDRKGASLPAIKSYITATYPHVDPNLMKSNVRKALEKGLDNGIIIRPKASEDNKGVTGRFKIDKAKQAALIKAAKPKAPPKSKTEDKPKKKAAPKKVKETLATKSPKKLKTPKKTSKSKTVKASKTAEKVPKSKAKPVGTKAKPSSKAKSPGKATAKAKVTTKATTSKTKKTVVKKTPTKAASKKAADT